jgi:small subunit ribosomal protein S8
MQIMRPLERIFTALFRLPHLFSGACVARGTSRRQKSKLVIETREKREGEIRNMSLNDPISNLLTIIRNGIQAHRETVDVPASKMMGKVLEIFKNDGYIEDFRLMKDSTQGTYKIYLKYDDKEPAIIGLKRVSRPGLRIYAKGDEIPRVLNGLGTAVISTSKGIVSDREARKLKIGGEVLCQIW